MSTVARNDYLETEVTTATPQKLQSMLIEAAIRKAQRCKECWRDNRDEEGIEALVRAQQIVTEVLCSLKVDPQDDTVRKIAGIYLFVFRTLARAQLERSESLLDEAIEVLEVERETWREACEKFGSQQTPGQAAIAVEHDPDEPGGADFHA